MDPVTGLMIGVAIVLAMLVIAFVWEIGRRAYYWIAAKTMGWDEHEKFMRETAWVEREATKNQLQREKEMEADTGDRRRMGAYFVAFTVTLLALHLGLPWWEVALVAIAAYLGLHMVGGITIKWSW